MSDIKTCFTSRFENGVLMEADFSQLEVVGLAILSQCPNLKEDILNGVDMHCRNAEFLFGIEYDIIKAGHDRGEARYSKMRQDAKGPGFLLNYGGGAALMAKNTGLPQSQCQRFIDNFYIRYYGVKEYQDAVMEEVKSNRKPSRRKTEKGYPACSGYQTSITGRRYVFYEFDGHRPGETSFSPTQMKNYSVQGFATGDIVPEVLGRLLRKVYEIGAQDNVKLIGTVHDSIVLDVSTEFQHKIVAEMVQSIMESAPKWMKERFGIEIDLPLKAEVGYGKTWAECK